MRLRDQVLVGVAVAAIGGGAAAFARERVEERSGRAAWAGRAARLGLTEVQKDEVRKLRTEAIRGMIRQRADLALARFDLGQLVDSPEPDTQSIEAKLKQVADLQAAALRARVTEQLALRRLLTPEQREKLRDLPPPRRPLGRRSGAGTGEAEPLPEAEDAPASAEGDDPLDFISLTAL